MLRRGIPLFARQLRSLTSMAGGSGRRLGVASFAAAASAAALGASLTWADAARPAATVPGEAKEAAAAAKVPPVAALLLTRDDRKGHAASSSADSAGGGGSGDASMGKDGAGREAAKGKQDPDALVDISGLQVYDRNWDGR